MLTIAQEKQAKAFGRRLMRHEAKRAFVQAAVCVDWWEIGRWLETDKSLHDGQVRAGCSTISIGMMNELSEVLGLSSHEPEKRNDCGATPKSSGTSNLHDARKFYRAAPSETQRDALIAEYETWSHLRRTHLRGHPKGSNPGHRGRQLSGWPVNLYVPVDAGQRLRAIEGATWHLVRQVLRDAFLNEANLQYLEVLVKQAVAEQK